MENILCIYNAHCDPRLPNVCYNLPFFLSFSLLIKMCLCVWPIYVNYLINLQYAKHGWSIVGGTHSCCNGLDLLLLLFSLQKHLVSHLAKSTTTFPPYPYANTRLRLELMIMIAHCHQDDLSSVMITRCQELQLQFKQLIFCCYIARVINPY